jgi:hypothetical protein
MFIPVQQIARDPGKDKINMIYTNKNRTAEIREMYFGQLSVLAYGEQGRGRREMLIPSTQDLNRGENAGLTVGFSQSGNPKITAGDGGMFLLIDTAEGYTRRGNGIVQAIGNVTVLSRGNSADGDAGRIGYADCLLLSISGDGFVTFRMGGGGSRFYLAIVSGKVIELGTAHDLALAEDATGIHVPGRADGRLTEEWTKL